MKNMNEEELLKELEKRSEEYNEEMSQIPHNLSISEFCRLSEKASKKVLEVSRQYRKIKTPNYVGEISKYGSVMTIKMFISSCKGGMFIDDDGYGRYIKDGKETDIEIMPSDIKYNAVRDDFTEMIWFNN